jgi:hypothetical protein
VGNLCYESIREEVFYEFFGSNVGDYIITEVARGTGSKLDIGNRLIRRFDIGHKMRWAIYDIESEEIRIIKRARDFDEKKQVWLGVLS